MLTLRDEDQVNAGKLRQLREERGWDWGQVARLSSLSVSQVRALETGSSACFYTLQIKNNAARKVAQVMGVAEAEVIIPQALPLGYGNDLVATADQVSVPAQAKAPVNAQNPVNLRSHISATLASSWVGYGAMSLLLIVGLGWYSLQTTYYFGDPKLLTTEALPTVSREVVSTTVFIDPSATVNLAAAASYPLLAETKPNSVNPKPVPVSIPPVQASQKPGEVELMPAWIATADATCQFDSNAAVIQAKKPTKSSEQISLMPRQAGLLCVQDGSGKVRRENLKPGTWSTFNGKAPWQLYSEALPNADIFFQGEKMRPAFASARHISLEDKQVDH